MKNDFSMDFYTDFLKISARRASKMTGDRLRREIDEKIERKSIKKILT